MKKQRYFIRNMDAGTYLEIFLVASVASILAIRAYLAITGYPQLGNSDLHIAHMLWGGVFMVVGIIALSMFLGKAAQYVGVICGGIGFGTFIDEVGKFITQDNDYFYQPSVSIMYVTCLSSNPIPRSNPSASISLPRPRKNSTYFQNFKARTKLLGPPPFTTSAQYLADALSASEYLR